MTQPEIDLYRTLSCALREQKVPPRSRVVVAATLLGAILGAFAEGYGELDMDDEVKAAIEFGKRAARGPSAKPAA